MAPQQHEDLLCGNLGASQVMLPLCHVSQNPAVVAWSAGEATSPQQGRGCGSRAGAQGAAGPAGPYLRSCLASGAGAEDGTVAPVLLGRDGSGQGKPGNETYLLQTS